MLARNAGIYGRELTNPDSDDVRDQFMMFVTQILDDVDLRYDKTRVAVATTQPEFSWVCQN